MCVCVCVCACVRVCVCVRVCLAVRVFMYVCACMLECVRECTLVCVIYRGSPPQEWLDNRRDAQLIQFGPQRMHGQARFY